MPRQITRRSVNRLAYVAPAVALTTTIGGRSAAAISGAPCAPGRCLVTVEVTDADTGQPIAGAFLDLPGDEAFTDAAGRFVGCLGVGGVQILAADYVEVAMRGYDFCTAAVHPFALQPL